MRSAAIAAAVLLLCACDRAPAPASATNLRDGVWVSAEGKHDDDLVRWQMRERYAVAPPRTQLLVVSLHYLTSRKDGQPEPDSTSDFADTEARLAAIVGAHGTLVAVMDYDAQHDWYFYVDDAALKQQVDADAKGPPARDIETSVESDPQAEFYGKLRQQVQ